VRRRRSCHFPPRGRHSVGRVRHGRSVRRCGFVPVAGVPPGRWRPPVSKSQHVSCHRDETRASYARRSRAMKRRSRGCRGDDDAVPRTGVARSSRG
jgi:hypothetical protein